MMLAMFLWLVAKSITELLAYLLVHPEDLPFILLTIPIVGTLW